MNATATAIKCGKSHGYHASVADVRRCYNGEDVPLVDVGRTPSGELTASPKQVNYATDLLNSHSAGTAKPVSAYGRREISELITFLRSTQPGQIRPRDFSRFGLVRDGASLAPNQPANHTDPRAREGYVQVPGLDKVWVPEGHTDQDHAAYRRNPARFDTETLEDGFYVLNGVVYKVVRAVHGNGRKYARRLDAGGNWVRTPGLSRLRPAMKMTLKEALSTAKRHGLNVQSALYGRCFVCGRTLTDDESIVNGIGPVCAGKFA